MSLYYPSWSRPISLKPSTPREAVMRISIIASAFGTGQADAKITERAPTCINRHAD
jgi:hypothetical protein